MSERQEGARNAPAAGDCDRCEMPGCQDAPIAGYQDATEDARALGNRPGRRYFCEQHLKDLELLWWQGEAARAMARGAIPEIRVARPYRQPVWYSPGGGEELMCHAYHATHSCGHQVWWSNPGPAALLAAYPCPWCGGETGQLTNHGRPQAAGELYGAAVQLDLPGVGPTRAYPRGDVGATGEGGRVMIHHRPDDSCCRGRLVSLG